jgi:hypothetical protein
VRAGELEVLVTVDNPKHFAASAEFTEAIISKLATGRGVHAETAISAAARMAGTLRLQSSGLPLADFEPGTSILSDLMDDLGQQLVHVFEQALASLEIELDPSRFDYDLADDHNPRMELLEVQGVLDAPFRSIMEKHGLTREEGAGAAAVAAAILVQKTAAVLDPHVGYVVAVYGMVESCKVVPFNAALDEEEPTGAKR